ncbi:MAG: hypothetical protein RIQ47_1613 [Bacteroidota bacterium]|jgi:diacylglycerol kinase (ATP)
MKRVSGLRFAFNGIAHSFRGQLNLRIHFIFAAAVILSGFLIEISIVEWCIIIICIGSVISAELFNTALENHVNMTHPEWNEAAGNTKDVAAGAVLIVCSVSSIIGIIIFLPRILEKFS